MEGKYTIGIDVGGTKVAYGLFDSEGIIIDRIQHPTDSEADGITLCDTLIRNIKALIAKHHLTFGEFRGVGVSMPSFILYEKGHILMTSSITGIKDFPMLDYLQEHLPVSIVLDNDANAAALAEYRHGAGRGVQHMVYIVVGTGLGGGIIINGKLFQGSYGWAGECGHMLSTPDEGIICGCENSGCYMSYTTGRFLPSHVKQRLDKGMKSVLTVETADGHSLKKAYKSGDALAVEIVEQMAHNLAVCVFNIYQMLNINTFVFGGGLVSFGDALFGRMREHFDRYNRIPLPVYFKIAELKKDFGIIGAAEFILSDSAYLSGSAISE